MSLIADERNRSIRLIVREGEIEVTAQSSEEGEGSEIVQADYKGEEIHARLQLAVPIRVSQQRRHRRPRGGSVRVRTGSEWVVRRQSVRRRNGHRPRGQSPLRITFEFKDANAQTQMSIAGETTYDYKYIVMPLRI